MNPGKPEKYTELAEKLRRYFSAGNFKRGDKLPSERDLSQKFECSHLTVRRALAVLEREEKIHSVPSKGIFAGARPRDERQAAIAGFLIPDREIYYFDLFAELEKRLRDMNLCTIFGISDSSPAKEHAFLRSLKELRATALIAMPNPKCQEEYASLHLPTVFFDNGVPGLKIPVVLSDDFGGALSAVEYLIRTGCRRIAHIGGIPDPAFENRLRGYREALLRHGIAENPELVMRNTPGREWGILASCKLFSLPNPPDAVFCANDAIAAGVQHYFRDKGKPPCPIIGFGGTSVSWDLGLNTVNQHPEKITEALVRNLRMILNGEEPPEETVIPSTIILRNNGKS